MKGGMSRAFATVAAMAGAMMRSGLAQAGQETMPHKKSRGHGRDKTSPSRHKVAMDKRAAVKARNRLRSKR